MVVPSRNCAESTIQAGRSIADTATECGLYFEIVQYWVAAALNATRQLLPQMWVDEGTCAEGLDALERYKYERRCRGSQE